MNNTQLIKELESYHIGKKYNSYMNYGAHMVESDGKFGVRFLVWAPNAVQVSVVGSFNDWDDHAHAMKLIEETGDWQLFIPNVSEGDVYKYKLFLPDGRVLYKADPYAFSSEVRPNTSSVIANPFDYGWHDAKWLENRQSFEPLKEPVNIYEVHLGSWNMKKTGHFDDEYFKSVDPSSFYNYRELADQLIPYLKKMHYNYIEIMPLMEHPFDGSWGYQVTGYYSITSRYGTPDDLKYLIDQCHQNQIGVIFDWVPGHFCRDEQGLMYFDGTELYGDIDHPNWGTKKFNFYKSEVRNFLISNALFFFEHFHIDGLRVDGVTSMLYLNFGLEGEPYKNRHGSSEDLDGIEFLKELNTIIFEKYPFAIMAAEESSSWPQVTHPVDVGGLGFNLKWKMGWMNDTLDYVALDPLFRKGSHNKITFSMHYAHSENFLLPFSHDEVVHGKKSLIEKCFGSYEEKFRTLRLMMLYQYTHPGKKLNFMGNEIAQFIEWRYYEPIEWFLLDYPNHQDHQSFMQQLNKLYLRENALYSKDFESSGFEWLDADNSDQSIFSYIRQGEDEEKLIILLNFTPIHYDAFRIGVPAPGDYRVVIQSDQPPYKPERIRYIKSEPIPLHGKKHSIELSIPGTTGMILKQKQSKR
ncbi:1,4-alpha-glucan branching enzyme [Pelagirhabdus alkalitolerans]|uniref:1,4-alpha-glucan branching enzyme GlgB n=1 Tax=Pelagirhabdus alkalitolerans TaxID=1612202 RepID=A0A1G6KAQ0_9BACI|nr:1,4-alpha-glucan branching protein GlgB [Pelagirhabdus alkalitolerans]SDC28007.1 1,4-alpha-glucan branching enzyme [Pelagirhabdus alkalitolerans]